ncbi:MAG: phosphatidylserine decarboxylase [Acidobacteria bacterium]|nr:phosphatidylserine decarboxylase [Acidobacteriota bacterium]
MPFDRAGWPFILAALVLAASAGWWFGRAWSIPFLILVAFFAFFFRDPDRTVPGDPRLVVAPADGRVMVAGGAPQEGAPAGKWQVITIFLSPLDVHVNRTPVDAVVTRVAYHPGSFLPAYKAEAGALNEWTEIWFERAGQPIVCRQIVGILARRIVCRLTPGQTVQRGERFGIMKFGSRIDLFLPLSAQVRVKVGDRVVGGETPLAVMER